MKKIIVALFFCIIFITTSHSTVFINETFEGSAPSFDFDNVRGSRVDGSCSSPEWGANVWCLEKSATGGWNSTGGAHIVTRSSEDQYDFGWFENSGWTGSDGDSFFIRFRQKFDSNFRWDGAGALSNKMILIGFDEVGSTRVIVFSRQPHPTVSCAGTPDPCGDGTCGTYAAGIGITSDCTGGLSTEHTYNEWLHVQVEFKCGSSGYVKIWVNNNTYASPTDQNLSIAPTCGNWGGEYKIGGFQTDDPARDQGWIIDDFQIADAFDSGWYASEGAPASPSMMGITITGASFN